MESFRNGLFWCISLLLMTIFHSCMNELKSVKEIEWDLSPEFGMPLARAELTFSGLFQPGKDSSLFLYPDKNGILHVCFNQNVDTLVMDNLLSEVTKDKVLLYDSIELPRVTKGISIESPATYFKMYLDSFLIEQQIDSVLLNSGIIEFEFKTWQNYDSRFSVTLPNLTDANKKSIQFLNFVPGTSNFRVALNLKDSKLKINTSDNSKGIFTIILAYEIKGKTVGKTIAPPVITVKMYDFDLKAAYGRMGNYDYDMDPIEIALFNSNPLGKQEINLDLAEPHIDLLFLNQFGFPFRYDFTRLGVVNNNVFSEITGVQQSVKILPPPLNGKNVFTKNLLSINPNSNLDQLISKFPQKLLVDGKIVINPDNPQGYNYIREEDMLVTRVEADIPLRFSLSQISIRDTSALDLSKLSTIEDNVDLIKLQTKVKNQFPLELNVQAYFTDTNYRIIDSLFSRPMNIKGAVSSGTPSESLFLVDKSNAQIRNLKNSKYMITGASFGTAGNSSSIVDFDTSQSLKMEIVGFTRINL
jgi:hypothetical protein